MQRVTVNVGVTLYAPIGDGKDYTGGDILDVPQCTADDWSRRGWVTITP